MFIFKSIPGNYAEEILMQRLYINAAFIYICKSLGKSE